MSDRSIQEAVQKLAGTHLKDNIHMIAATVKDVDQMARTCTCTPIGGTSVTDIANVQLMAEVDDGFLKIPTIGSTVIIMFSTRNIPYITLYSSLQNVILVTTEGIQFQGGELGGIPISQSIVDRFNLIENAFNLLNSKVNILAPTPAIPPLAETAINEIENSFIMQGAA